ncbi:ribonuclease inhibitor [Echinicola sp. CAU 1574]|uniref:Ribonuclease inhibitor n=1 Tax=Echinicola arenosa TaxID=2774144 RepID=A0ABR9AHE5_9BACT|nr:c-type cytochrome domain-containing protein [Echinicola arenosa]MBD8488188.1 ribonuclease inhibitor [Echinicola arenosa]
MRKTVYLLLIFQLITIPILYAQGVGAAAEETSDLWLFIGRFHPLIVHLPIGFIMLAFLMEVMARWPKFKHLEQSVSFVLTLGILSSVGAAVFGYLLSLSGEYQGSTLDWHLWLGLSTLGFAIIALVLKVKQANTAYFTFLSASVICLTLTGHLGGNLTHGSDYLVRYMPNSLRAMTGMPPKPESKRKPITNLEEAIVFDDLIKPITDNSCESCHNAEKTKGNLRLDTKEGFLKGGENGPSLVPGQAAHSELIKRVKLPKDHEDVMPPEGKKPLTKEEIALLEWWINNDASFDKKIAEVEVPDDIKEILDALVNPQQSSLSPLYAMEIKPASKDEVETLKDMGFSVSPISAESPFIQVSYLISGQPLNEESIKALKKVAKQTTWLNLGKAALADGQKFTFLKDFNHLTQLHLEKTAITDEEVKNLVQMEFLEYLNLYNTAITDKSVEPLTALKRLRKIYLWETQVSEDGKSSLQKAIPELAIIADGLPQNFDVPLDSLNDSTVIAAK